MPEISRFFGIIISMNYSEHPPPHFHVTYGSQQATVDIVDLRVTAGRLSPRVLGMVMEWAALHQLELVVDLGVGALTATPPQGFAVRIISCTWEVAMLNRVKSVTVIGKTLMAIEFEDGAKGEIDVARLFPFRGVFAQLVDPGYFAMVQISGELGTIGWPNGADLDSDMLYSQVTGRPVQVDSVPADQAAYEERWQRLLASAEVQRRLHQKDQVGARLVPADRFAA